MNARPLGRLRRALTLAAVALLAGVGACADAGSSGVFASHGLALCSQPVPVKNDYTVAIPLPPGLAIGDITLLSTDTLELRDVDVLGTVVNMGLGDTTVFSGATIGNIFSRGQVDLRDGSTVLGIINTTTEEAVQGGNVNYDPDLVDINYAFDPITEVRLNFPEPADLDQFPNVWVEPQQVHTLAPGNYNRLDARNDAEIVLRPGVYWVDTLAMEPQAFFTIDTAACAPCSVVFNVKELIDPALRGFPAGPAPDFLLLYHGSAELTVNAQFNGFVIAMNASVRFNNDAPHVGAHFAKSLIIDAGQTINHRPFDPALFEVWEP